MNKQSNYKGQAATADSTRNSELNGALGDEVIKRIRIAAHEFRRITGINPVSVYLGYAEFYALKNCQWAAAQLYSNPLNCVEPKIEGKRLLVVTRDHHLAVA